MGRQIRHKIFPLKLSCVILCIFCSYTNAYYRHRSVFQQISSEEKFSTFNALIQDNSLAKRAILYWNSTVFVPTNSAIQKYNGTLTKDLVYYHISNELKSVRMIFDSHHLSTLSDAYPPLWISKINGEIYVNNAKIISKESDYFSKAAGGYYNHNQVLHVIDEVLEPPSIHLDCPTALDLIINNTHDPLLPTSNYSSRITQTKATKYFTTIIGNTYFVPIDTGFNEYRYRITDKYIIEAHVVPNQVLFTKPTIGNFYFETRSNGDYIYILASFVEKSGKLYVRSNTILGDSNHQKGEMLSEVIRANIPVKNGVVHFIEKPLGIFDMHLRPFPFLPILNKLSGDPELNITYQLGEITKFNEHLKNTHSLLTFFIPHDRAWKNIIDNSTEITEEHFKLLGRHLVISDVRHTMQKLWIRSFDREIVLNTVGGPVDLKIIKDESDNYSILYGGETIKVIRPDYICTNGIIHVIDRTFTATRKDTPGKIKMNFWRSLEDFIF